MLSKLFNSLWLNSIYQQLCKHRHRHSPTENAANPWRWPTPASARSAGTPPRASMTDISIVIWLVPILTLTTTSSMCCELTGILSRSSGDWWDHFFLLGEPKTCEMFYLQFRSNAHTCRAWANDQARGLYVHCVSPPILIIEIDVHFEHYNIWFPWFFWFFFVVPPFSHQRSALRKRLSNQIIHQNLKLRGFPTRNLSDRSALFRLRKVSTSRP